MDVPLASAGVQAATVSASLWQLLSGVHGRTATSAAATSASQLPVSENEVHADVRPEAFSSGDARAWLCGWQPSPGFGTASNDAPWRVNYQTGHRRKTPLGEAPERSTTPPVPTAAAEQQWYLR